MLLLPSAPSGTQLTNEQKELLLDLHNRARSMVDPIATNMEEMVRSRVNNSLLLLTLGKVMCSYAVLYIHLQYLLFAKGKGDKV